MSIVDIFIVQQLILHLISRFLKLEKAASGTVLDKDMEHIIKAQELLFKRQLKQYSSKVTWV